MATNGKRALTAHAHACIQMYTQAHVGLVQKYVRTYVRASVRAFMHAYIQTYIKNIHA